MRLSSSVHVNVYVPMQKVKKRKDAVVKIQSTERARAARKNVEAVRKNAKETEAATKIQVRHLSSQCLSACLPVGFPPVVSWFASNPEHCMSPDSTAHSRPRTEATRHARHNRNSMNKPLESR